MQDADREPLEIVVPESGAVPHWPLRQSVRLAKETGQKGEIDREREREKRELKQSRYNDDEQRQGMEI